MLESFAAWILNTYIGDYFGNVNTHQLRMSLKNGMYPIVMVTKKNIRIKLFRILFFFPDDDNVNYQCP